MIPNKSKSNRTESPLPQALLTRFTTTLKHAGIKLTHQRLEIFREVVAHNGHPDVETIYLGVRSRMPSVSQDTIYRTLKLFTDLGLITTLGPPRERIRFDTNTNPHHHFVCTRCGAAFDFYHAAFDRLTAPDDVQALGSVATIHVEFRGVCTACARKTKLR